LPVKYPNIKLNEKGICNYCLEGKLNSREVDDKKTIEKRKIEFRKDFENLVKSCKGKSEYDCLLLYSGGKDSTYLLYLLKEIYGLKVLAVTVNNGLMQESTKENIKNIVKHFNVDHVSFTPENDFHKRLFRYYLTHKVDDELYSKKICGSCANIIISTGLNIATEKKIPFVALGYAPNQTTFYEYSKEELLKSWVPKELYDEIFSDKDRSYFWNPENINKNDIPRFILPYYILEYPGVEGIIKKLTELGLGTKKTMDPIKSNCHMCWLLYHLDIKKHGYFTGCEGTSNLIRAGKIKNRTKYFLIYTLGFWLLKHGLVKRKFIKKSLNHLNLKIANIS